MPVKQIGEFERQLALALAGPYAVFREKLAKTGDLTNDLKTELDALLAKFKESFHTT